MCEIKKTCNILKIMVLFTNCIPASLHDAIQFFTS